MKKKILATVCAAIMGVCAFCACTPANTEPKEPTIVMPDLEISLLGDSITYGSTVNIGTEEYGSLLSLQDYVTKVNNYGISGSTIGNNKNYNPFVSRYTNISATSDVIFVFGGTNDYGSKNGQEVKLGKKGDDTDTTFYGALEILMNGLENYYTDADVYFITPLQRKNSTWGYPSGETSRYGFTVKDYRDAIIDMCETHGLKYIDFYNLEGMRLEDETFDSYFNDGLHPNAEGHKLIASKIDSVLRADYGMEI